MSALRVLQTQLQSSSCSTCQAYSTELCNKVGSNTVIIAITMSLQPASPCKACNPLVLASQKSMDMTALPITVAHAFSNLPHQRPPYLHNIF